MKNSKSILIVFIIFIVYASSFSQTINWASLIGEQQQLVHVNSGWDYGLVFGAGYSHQLKLKTPVMLNISYSFPSGKKVLDDFKTKVGGQVRIYRLKNFQLSTSVQGVYRRYQNPLLCIQNFGSEITGVIGYYRTKWFVAAEAGFDKAIVTYFKHSKIFRDNIYGGVQDGWYQPATGGNFLYGIQFGYSYKQSDITLKIGKVITQDFKTTPLIPYYLQLGYNFRIQ